MRKIIHKTHWWCNQKSNPPVILAGEVSECGTEWVVGSRVWKNVTCKKCLRKKSK